MSYIAGIFLMNMGPYEAFVCFSNLMHTHLFTSLYDMDLPEMLKHIKIYELMFSENIPDLFEHFKVIFFFDFYFFFIFLIFFSIILSESWY